MLPEDAVDAVCDGAELDGGSAQPVSSVSRGVDGLKATAEKLISVGKKLLGE